MSVIFAKAPLRISLGGGGTDIPSYYAEHGGFLIAAAIDKYIYILAHTVFQQRYRLKYSEFEEVDDPSEIKHPILREALSNHWSGSPLEIASVADIPAGTGLGSSGAYTVCLLKALSLAQRMAVTPEALAERACHIEIDLLGEPSGKQDQYVAAHGGVCAYTFHGDGKVSVEPLELAPATMQELADNMQLFFTGETRSASSILKDQDERTKQADKAMVDNLHRTKEIGIESRKLLEQGELRRFGELMDVHWRNKRKRSPSMSSSHIDDLYEIAIKNGAVGGKLVGAGGGGFLLVYSENPQLTRKAMADQGIQEVRFDVDLQGCVGIEYG